MAGTVVAEHLVVVERTRSVRLEIHLVGENLVEGILVGAGTLAGGILVGGILAGEILVGEILVGGILAGEILVGGSRLVEESPEQEILVGEGTGLELVSAKLSRLPVSWPDQRVPESLIESWILQHLGQCQHHLLRD